MKKKRKETNNLKTKKQNDTAPTKWAAMEFRWCLHHLHVHVYKFVSGKGHIGMSIFS